MQALEKYGHNIVIGENFANFLILRFFLSLNLTLCIRDSYMVRR
jgi:hypothetical protein